MIEVTDKFNTSTKNLVVATAAIFMHWSTTGVGIGKYHASGTLDVLGTIYSDNIRLNGTGDVSLTSTTHPFQVGLSTSTNMAFDTNELQARNNGVAAGFTINMSGGNVTLGDLNSVITLHGSVIEPEMDTGWVTSGLTITMASGWTLTSYRLRKIRNRVVGRVIIVYAGAGITADATGNFTDITSVYTLPTGWRNNQSISTLVPFIQSGTKTMWGRANTTNVGTVDFTHGSFNGQVVATSTTFETLLDYLTD